MGEYKTTVCYEDFGAVGDGEANDFAAIRQAHAYANENALRVVTDPTKIYYIGNDRAEALIETDTDWSTTRFIIDDTGVALEDRGLSVFRVRSGYLPIELDAPDIKKGQMKLDARLTGNVFAVAIDADYKQFRRVGLNQSAGHPKTDCFIIDQTGAILTPVLWDFDHLTSLTAYPIDKRTLTIKGGIFTTIANQAESRYTYYNRGILITRSNVVVDGLVHGVSGELDHGAPYHGFVRTEDCAYITFNNCHFTGHKIYETIGAANLPVMMGTYDISLYRSIGIHFYNCRQDNILDATLWGVFTSNYCKDILVDGCVFSRVDAHMDVTDYTIKNSVIGWQGLKAIGHGRMLVENVTIFAGEVVQLRGDYGSTWDGSLVLRDIVWYPIGRGVRRGANNFSIITSTNAGNHDFGYICSQPKKVSIENLRVMDNEQDGGDYAGVSIFSVDAETNSGVASFDDTAEGDHSGDHPYVFTSELTVRGLYTNSGKGFAIWSSYPENGYCEKTHNVGEGVFQANFRADINGVDAFNMIVPADTRADYGANHRLAPLIEVTNYERLSVQEGACPMRINVK